MAALSIPFGRAVKAKGYRFEKHIETVLNDAGITAERNGSRFGANDHGDIAVDGIGLAIQAKDTKTQALLNTMDAAWRQAVAAGVPHGIAVFRYRRGADYGPHERNVWCFEEKLAVELLALYRQQPGDGDG